MAKLINAFLYDDESGDEKNSDKQAEPDVADEECVGADDKSEQKRNEMFASDAIDNQGQPDNARDHNDKQPAGVGT